MLSIEISERVETMSDVVDLLRRIADIVEQSGVKTGFGPDFEITGTEQ
jgi:hypothetical protein